MNRGLTFTPKKSNLFSHQKTKGTKKKKKKKLIGELFFG